MLAAEKLPETIEQIVEEIEAAHKRLVAAIAPLSDIQLQAPLLADDWSVKDVLAHLTFWDERLLYGIAPASDPHANRLTPPAIADIPLDDEWLETVNARVYAINCERDLRSVQEDFDATRRRLLDVVASLTLHDVYDASGLSAGLGEPFAPMLRGAYEHYDDHIAELVALSQ